ncbi:hypothetical protein NPIL_490481 [Nephila pilipes]|uniref:Uncharacterized protein n=1 Tax=Nephila pilipes TaxID=299642 RepID=A0A8X6IVS1_NEPPI|nr:hypothetical protein NPIL_490481 [Nephila pilipes]
MHLLRESNGIAISSIRDFVPLLASRTALSLTSISACDDIHWNSTILPFIISPRVTCFILLTIKDSKRYWNAIVSMADLESTRITAFSRSHSRLQISYIQKKLAWTSESKLAKYLPTGAYCEKILLCTPTPAASFILDSSVWTRIHSG